MTMKRLALGTMVACAATALAMPTKQEISKAQPFVAELMAPIMDDFKAKKKTAAEVAEAAVAYAAEAKTEPAKFMLYRSSVPYYVRGEAYDKAAEAIDLLKGNVKDVPAEVILEILVKASVDDLKERAPRLYAMYRQAKRQVSAENDVKGLRKKPASPANRRKLAEALATAGNWSEALKEFASLRDDTAQMAKKEQDGSAANAELGEFWWTYAPTYKNAEDTFKLHAAYYYRKALAADEITGLKKNIVEQRIKEYGAVSAVAADGAGSAEAKRPVERELTFAGYLPRAKSLLLKGIALDEIREFAGTVAGSHVGNPEKAKGYVVGSGDGWKTVQFQLVRASELKCVQVRFEQGDGGVHGFVEKSLKARSNGVPLGSDINSVGKKWFTAYGDDQSGWGIKDLSVTVGGKDAATSAPVSAVTSTALGTSDTNPAGQQRSVAAEKGMILPLSKKVAIEFVPCPAGSFMMGRKGDEAAFSGTRYHKVNITRKFWMSKYKITKAQWEAVEPPTCAKCYKPEAQGKIGNLPAYCVSFNQVRSFCDHVNKLVNSKLPRGCVVRLPTEAEWEYALTAGCTDPNDPYLRYRDGNKEEHARARSEIRVASVTVKEEFMPLAVEWIQKKDFWDRLRYHVGTRKPNNWGIYDMLSNGSEYTLDTFWHPSNNDYNMASPTQRGLVYEEEETDPLRVYVPEGKKAVACMIRGGGDNNKFDGDWFRKKTLPTFTDYEGSGFHLVIGPDLVSEWKAKHAKK